MAKSPDRNEDGKVSVQEMLDSLAERVEALETAATENTGNAPNTDQFEQRLSAVEQRDNNERFTAFEQRIDALENQDNGAAVVSPQDFNNLSERVDALENRPTTVSTGDGGLDIDASHVNYVMQKFFPHDRPTLDGTASNTQPSFTEGTADPVDARRDAAPDTRQATPAENRRVDDLRTTVDNSGNT